MAQSSPGDDAFPPGVKALDKVYTEVKALLAFEGIGSQPESVGSRRKHFVQKVPREGLSVKRRTTAVIGSGARIVSAAACARSVF